MLLSGARVVFEDEVVEEAWVRISGGVIDEIGRGETPPPGDDSAVDCKGMTIVPGFVDIHVHGGGGASFLDGDPSAVANARAYHRLRGTTRSLASLVSAPVDDLCESLSRLAPLVERDVISGVHLEGPFLSPARFGAQDPEHFLAPDAAILARLLDAGRGAIRMITLAPELPGAMELIPVIREAGAICAIGHTDATFEVANAAFDAGASVTTHLWNAMRSVHQRDPGVVLATLLREAVSCEVIADGAHLHPGLVRFAAKTLGERLVFVSDSTAAAGMTDGTTRLGSVDVDIVEGVARVRETGSIAGSTATLSSIVRHAVLEAGVSLLDAVNAASSRPAKLIGLGDVCGLLAPGRPADLVLLDDSLEVVSVMVGERFLEESTAD
jgi:N-acetylglucosamine-6-phosphate deacetylase